MINGTGNGLRLVRLRWHLANPLLRLSAQAAIVAVLAVAGFAFLRIGDAINETAASVLIAVVFGVSTVFQVRQTQRRQHTVDLLTNFQSSEALSVADVWMAHRIAQHRQIEVDIPLDEERHVIAMLDYYDFLSELALRGLVDVSLLLGQRGGAMTRCFGICRGYITNRRGTVAPDLYSDFEILVGEHARRVRNRNSAPAGQGAQFSRPADAGGDS